jgi:hypothetical protein
MLVQETKSPNKAVVALIVVTLLAAVAAGSLYVYNSRNEVSSLAQSTNSVASPTAASNSQTTSTATTSSYKNGTYTATGNYSTPESSESIDLTVTIVDSTITNVSIQNSGNVRESRDYQQRFMHNCTNLVVGKNIDSVSLSRVAGSSLTSDGFNSALEQIKADATA